MFYLGIQQLGASYVCLVDQLPRSHLAYLWPLLLREHLVHLKHAYTKKKLNCRRENARCSALTCKCCRHNILTSILAVSLGRVEDVAVH